jgi:hypothetical protein
MKFGKENTGNKLTIVAALMLIASAIWSNPALAAGSIGSMLQNAATDLISGGKLIEVVAYVGGLGFVVVGLFKFITLSNQPGTPKGPAIICIVVGALLLGVGVFTSAISGTFGSDGASTGLGKLGIGG